MSVMKNSPGLYILLCLLIMACSKKNSPANGTPPAVIVPPIVVAADTSLYKMVPFPMGAAVAINLVKNNAKYSGIVTKEFNSITAENAMKFSGLHPAENTFFWTDADYLVAYAQTNNKRLHGHTLNWYQSMPTWVTNFSGDSTAWEKMLKTHIQTVVAHFKGKVAAWDVVNEYFNDNGTVRNSLWVQKLGEDYIARCFQYANQADPDVLLFYNDYGHEYSTAKRTAITNMIASFKTRGIPIHGIGLQFHLSVGQPDANISAAIASAAATGLQVHISELDIRLNANKAQTFPFTTTMASQQAAKYEHVVKAYKSILAAQQYGITTWNVTDADSWIPNWQGAPDYPLPFDANYQRKEAYRGIVRGAK